VRLEIAPSRFFPCPSPSPRLGADRRRANVVTISRRIGHANPAVTLAVYAHVFAGTNKDIAAAAAIEAAMGAK